MRVTPETVAGLVADYKFGLSSTALQAKYDLSKGSVLLLLAEAGVVMRRRELSETQADVVMRRYKDGLTIRADRGGDGCA